MKKSPTNISAVMAHAALLVTICLGATGCVDARSAAHSTVGFLAAGGDGVTERSSVSRPQSAPEPVSLGGDAGVSDGLAMPGDLTIELASSPGRISAFGLGWIAAPTADEPWPVRDLPDVTSELVGSLAAWETDFWVAERTRQTTDGTWRRVTLNDGSVGWIEAENLLAQPATVSAKDRKAIQAMVEAGIEELASSSVALPESVHRVLADSNGKQRILLIDWSGRQIRPIAVFSEAGAQ